MKGLLQKVVGLVKGLIDLDHDGHIEVVEVFKIVLAAAPVLSSPALDLLKGHIGTIASGGRIVDPDGGTWTAAQTAAAFDELIAAADKLIDTADADSVLVRAILAARAAGSQG